MLTKDQLIKKIGEIHQKFDKPTIKEFIELIQEINPKLENNRINKKKFEEIKRQTSDQIGEIKNEINERKTVKKEICDFLKTNKSLDYETVKYFKKTVTEWNKRMYDLGELKIKRIALGIKIMEDCTAKRGFKKIQKIEKSKNIIKELFKIIQYVPST